MKQIIIEATTTAQIGEKWVYQVADDFVIDSDNVSDLLDDPDGAGAKLVDVSDWVIGDEADRDITNVAWRVNVPPSEWVPREPRAFRVLFKQDEYRIAFVDAMDEAEAKQKVEDCDFDDSEFAYAENTYVINVEDVS